MLASNPHVKTVGYAVAAESGDGDSSLKCYNRPLMMTQAHQASTPGAAIHICHNCDSDWCLYVTHVHSGIQSTHTHIHTYTQQSLCAEFKVLEDVIFLIFSNYLFFVLQ